MINTNVLVVGGAGYIGSIVVEELLRYGYQVVVVDNLSTGHRDAVDERIPFYQASCGDVVKMRRIFSENEIDVVMHFAAFALVFESMQNPEKYYQNNIIQTLNLLQVMREFECLRFIFSSTVAVFGEPEILPIDENHPKNPINNYGFSKLVVERVLEEYHRVYGLNYNIFRYFNAAGASTYHGERHDHETHIIPLLLKTALGRNGNFVLYGNDFPTRDGTCIRDYIHVLDLADAHIKGINNIKDHPNGSYNLGNGKGFSNQEIIQAVKNVTGRDFNVEIGPRRLGDPSILVASSEKARCELTWEPRYNEIEKIVDSAYKYYKSL